MTFDIRIYDLNGMWMFMWFKWGNLVISMSEESVENTSLLHFMAVFADEREHIAFTFYGCVCRWKFCEENISKSSWVFGDMVTAIHYNVPFNSWGFIILHSWKISTHWLPGYVFACINKDINLFHLEIQWKLPGYVFHCFNTHITLVASAEFNETQWHLVYWICKPLGSQ